MMRTPEPLSAPLEAHLGALHLLYIREHYQALANEAATKQWSHLDYLAGLIEGEAHRREDRSIERRIRCARFPVQKSLEDFQWSWPKKINPIQVQNLFRLAFIDTHTNIILLGGVGLGKTHLCIALGHSACLRGYSVLFTTAVDIINTLAAAQAAGTLKREMNRYLKPRMLIIDELGYLPIDKHGADLLFQIISQRYERGPILITTNRAYKYWPEIFNNDSTLTSALLDRLLHHAQTIVIEGKSYRMKDQNENSFIPTTVAHHTPDLEPAMDLEYATELFYRKLSDEAAAHIAEFLMQLALCFENTHLPQIQRHYRDARPQSLYDPNQLDLFTGNDPF